MTDLVLFHNNSCRLFPSFLLHFLIAQTIEGLIISIYAQKLMEMDWYWWSFSPAKFDAAMMVFKARTRQAISSSILAPICQTIHENVDNDVVYHGANREADMTSSSYLIIWYNAEVGLSWLEVRGAQKRKKYKICKKRACKLVQKLCRNHVALSV